MAGVSDGDASHPHAAANQPRKARPGGLNMTRFAMRAESMANLMQRARQKIFASLPAASARKNMAQKAGKRMPARRS